ncbi:MAG: 8-amino-7-oxononanoate synthase [Nitrospirota bacterium]
MFEDELDKLERLNLLRSLKIIDTAQSSRVTINGREVILLSSNNYLGLANHPKLKKAAIEAVKEYGVGSGASRLISGNMRLHEELEERIARFKKTESALIFNSGYTANTGIIPAIVGEGDVIFSDELNHASIIDGCRLSKAEIKVYPHKDVNFLEDILKKENRTNKRLIITDSVFSMDGDIAPLLELYRIAERYSAMLMVDEAHATGVLGDSGRGAVEYLGLEGKRIIQMGTLSKALGCFGGYIAGEKNLIRYLVNRARSFIYTTSLPPSVVASAIAAFDVIEEDPSIIRRLWRNRRLYVEGLKNLDMDIGETETPIVPIMVSKPDEAVVFAESLFERGIYAPAIRPPTVPSGKSRIRTTITAEHTEEDIKEALSIIEEVIKGI